MSWEGGCDLDFENSNFELQPASQCIYTERSLSIYETHFNFVVMAAMCIQSSLNYTMKFHNVLIIFSSSSNESSQSLFGTGASNFFLHL